MATNTSEHLGLNLWEPNDQVLREEFNENWQKLDEEAADIRADLSDGLAAASAALTQGLATADANLAAAEQTLTQTMNQKEQTLTQTMNQSISNLAAAVGSGGKTCRIAYGTYTGTGTYGSANPSSLTFDFCPVMVVLGSYELTGTTPWPTVAIRGVNGTHSESDSTRLYVTWKTNGISWYSSQGQVYQNNYSGRTYAYVVLGYSAE